MDLPEDLKPQPLRGHTTCENCGVPIHVSEALIITKKTNREDLVFAFCGEKCSGEFYLERLRAGL